MPPPSCARWRGPQRRRRWPLAVGGVAGCGGLPVAYPGRRRRAAGCRRRTRTPRLIHLVIPADDAKNDRVARASMARKPTPTEPADAADRGARQSADRPLTARSRRMPSLPSDCVLLPIASGALLVSRSHATFCAVPREHLHAVSEIARWCCGGGAPRPWALRGARRGTASSAPHGRRRGSGRRFNSS